MNSNYQKIILTKVDLNQCDVVQKPSLLCIQSSSCDLCGELLEGIAYTIYVGTWSELHCMVMSKMHHMQ